VGRCWCAGAHTRRAKELPNIPTERHTSPRVRSVRRLPTPACLLHGIEFRQSESLESASPAHGPQSLPSCSYQTPPLPRSRALPPVPAALFGHAGAGNGRWPVLHVCQLQWGH